MTLAIAHKLDSEDRTGKVVLDVVREVKPPFSPEAVVREFAAVLQAYRIHEVTGDRVRRRVASRGVPQVWCRVPELRADEERPLPRAASAHYERQG
jgi:hypothetical protein